jgi:hypothetical protein
MQHLLMTLVESFSTNDFLDLWDPKVCTAITTWASYSLADKVHPENMTLQARQAEKVLTLQEH